MSFLLFIYTLPQIFVPVFTADSSAAPLLFPAESFVPVRYISQPAGSSFKSRLRAFKKRKRP